MTPQPFLALLAELRAGMVRSLRKSLPRGGAVSVATVALDAVRGAVSALGLAGLEQTGLDDRALYALAVEEASTALDDPQRDARVCRTLAKSFGGRWWPVSDAGAWLLKARAVKYIRKVPIGTTKTGRIRYRYYYHDAATAHAAAAGEQINIRGKGVHEVVRGSGGHGSIKLRHTETGAERELTHAELHAEMAAAYRARFDKGAERLMRRFLRDVEGLPAGSGPDAVFETFADRFRVAKVSPSEAKAIIAHLESRKGWQDDAKRALLALASDSVQGRRVASNARQIVAGAENLRNAEGRRAVSPSHVGQAALLRLRGDDSSDRVVELQGKAKAEIARIEAALGAIDVAKGNAAVHRAMLDYAKGLVDGPPSAVLELEHAADAYPGLRGLDELDALRKARGRWAAALARHKLSERPKGGLGLAGADTTIFVADASGSPTPQRGRYRLVEADAAIASHDPARSFAPRPEYPEGLQERAYHRDRGEQEKVRGNAQLLRPEYVVNTNPDAVNGPPVLTQDGIVLGGNSRTMSIQSAYDQHPDKAADYQRYLSEHAGEFGFTAEDVKSFKQPLLVREVDVEDASHGNLSTLVRRYNESFTQAMDPRTDQVARGRLVTQAMLDTLGVAMGRENRVGELMYPTLREFLSSSEGRSFVNDLQSVREGKAILDKRTRAAYVSRDGKLNEDGKTLVERVLVGHLLPDPDLLSDLLPSHVSAVAASVPHLVRAAANGHDLRGPLREGLQMVAYMRRTGLANVSELDRDRTFGDLAPDAGFEAAPKPSPLGRRVAELLVDRGLLGKPSQMASYFRDFATLAQRNPANGQGGLAGAEPRSTGDLLGLNESRQGDASGQQGLFKAGPFYGPKGGKWADPGHKIPWHEAQHQIGLFTGETPKAKPRELQPTNVSHVTRALRDLRIPMADVRSGRERSGAALEQWSDSWVALAWKDHGKDGDAKRRAAKLRETLTAHGFEVSDRWGAESPMFLVGRMKPDPAGPPNPPKGGGKAGQLDLFKRLRLVLALRKGANHRYIRRVPTGRVTRSGRMIYRYYYRVTGGAGLGHRSEIVAGAKFRAKDDAHVKAEAGQPIPEGTRGHFEVVSVDGDQLTIRHDETGKERTLSRAELQRLLHGEHHNELFHAGLAARRDYLQARVTGTAKQRARAYDRAIHVEATAQRGRGWGESIGESLPKPEGKAKPTEAYRKLEHVVDVLSNAEAILARYVTDSNLHRADGGPAPRGLSAGDIENVERARAALVEYLGADTPEGRIAADRKMERQLSAQQRRYAHYELRYLLDVTSKAAAGEKVDEWRANNAMDTLRQWGAVLGQKKARIDLRDDKKNPMSATALVIQAKIAEDARQGWLTEGQGTRTGLETLMDLLSQIRTTDGFKAFETIIYGGTRHMAGADQNEIVNVRKLLEWRWRESKKEIERIMAGETQAGAAKLTPSNMRDTPELDRAVFEDVALLQDTAEKGHNDYGVTDKIADLLHYQMSEREPGSYGYSQNRRRGWRQAIERGETLPSTVGHRFSELDNDHSKVKAVFRARFGTVPYLTDDAFAAFVEAPKLDAGDEIYTSSQMYNMDPKERAAVYKKAREKFSGDKSVRLMQRYLAQDEQGFGASVNSDRDVPPEDENTWGRSQRAVAAANAMVFASEQSQEARHAALRNVWTALEDMEGAIGHRLNLSGLPLIVSDKVVAFGASAHYRPAGHGDPLAAGRLAEFNPGAYQSSPHVALGLGFEKSLGHEIAHYLDERISHRAHTAPMFGALSGPMNELRDKAAEAGDTDLGWHVEEYRNRVVYAKRAALSDMAYQHVAMERSDWGRTANGKAVLAVGEAAMVKHPVGPAMLDVFRAVHDTGAFGRWEQLDQTETVMDRVMKDIGGRTSKSAYFATGGEAFARVTEQFLHGHLMDAGKLNPTLTHLEYSDEFEDARFQDYPFQPYFKPAEFKAQLHDKVKAVWQAMAPHLEKAIRRGSVVRLSGLRLAREAA